jgi:hypothetical protein
MSLVGDDCCSILLLVVTADFGFKFALDLSPLSAGKILADSNPDKPFIFIPVGLLPTLFGLRSSVDAPPWVFNFGDELPLLPIFLRNY